MHFETTASIVLTAWERAYGLGPVERGLALLSLARPDDALSNLVQLTIGDRDSELLRLRQRLFGNDIHSLDVCPECSEKIEVSFCVRDICVSAGNAVTESRDDTIVDRLAVNGRSLSIRPATTADLIAVEQAASPQSRRDALLRRCVSVLDEADDEAIPASVLPLKLSEASVKTINDRLSEIDPQADVRIAMDCTRCNHTWSSRFDIVSFLWTEIDVWAQRLLAEVHSLAFAYGWSEHDILNMSPWRRHLYLGMLRR